MAPILSASSAECVTTISVTWSSRFNSTNRSPSDSAVEWSSAPVGSSARMRLGRLISARTTATRWHSPPDSWAAREDADVAIFTLKLAPGASFTLPPARAGTNRAVYFFGGESLRLGDEALALGSGARFVGRGIDVSKNLPDVLKAAHAHQGAAFVEIFQNCIVYNKDVFDDFAAPKGAEDRQLWLEDGKPMLFAGETKGIALDRDALELKVVDVADGDWEAAGVLVHDVTKRQIAHMLVDMPFGPFPMALGVLYDDARPTFESAVIAEREQASAGKEANLTKLLAKGQTWTVSGTAQDPV